MYIVARLQPVPVKREQEEEELWREVHRQSEKSGFCCLVHTTTVKCEAFNKQLAKSCLLREWPIKENTFQLLQTVHLNKNKISTNLSVTIVIFQLCHIYNLLISQQVSQRCSSELHSLRSLTACLGEFSFLSTQVYWFQDYAVVQVQWSQCFRYSVPLYHLYSL